MRILILCDVLFPHTVGGAGRFTRELGEALVRCGDDVRYLTRETGTPHSGLIPSTSFPPYGSAGPRVYRTAFGDLLREFRPDIVNYQQPLPAWLCIPESYSGPTVYTFFSSWPDEILLKSSRVPRLLRRAVLPAFRAIERRAAHRAQAITALSEYSQREVKRLYGRDATVIPGGVDTQRFRPLPMTRNDGTIRLITVRNLVPRMGLSELIRSMTQLPGHVHLEIAGRGPLHLELDTLIRDLRLTDRVRLRGHVPDDELPAFYNSADWFVLPTVALEGFGLVILESLACGTPVLGTRIGAIPELLERFDPSWVIAEPSAESIATTVQQAIDGKRPRRDELHQRCADEFSWNLTAQQYRSLFMSVRGQ